MFYEFRLEDRIPQNHLLRRIDVVVTAALADLHQELEPYYSDIGCCLDFITGADGDPGSVRDQLRRLEARTREITADLKAQQGDIEIAIHPNLPELYRRKVVRLQQILESGH